MGFGDRSKNASRSPAEGADRTLSSSGFEVAAANRVGAYRLLQKVSEGGMGEVYLAEQREPIRRRVAVDDGYLSNLGPTRFAGRHSA